MSFNDPIAELLALIKNALGAKHKYVDVYMSGPKIEIVKKMKERGYVQDFLLDEKKRKMRIFLKYNKKREPLINQIRRISKPGLRRYAGYKKLPRVMNGIGMALLSTSQGIMDDATARELKVGGEILCYVW